MDTTTAPATPKRHRRVLAGALIFTGLVAAAPGVATLAGFTAQDVNRDNSIESGTLDVAVGQAEKYFEVRNMKPGDTTVQTVKVINTGSRRQDFALDTVNVKGNLDDVLTVSVAQDGKVLAEGAKLSELAPVMSGLQSGEATAYDISVSWPENAPEIDNKYQAGAVSFDFQVDATQLDGAAITNGDNAGN